jgi:hypothetical protein
VRLGSDGTVAFDNASSGTVDLVADLSGYYRTDGKGLRFHPTAPTRAFDTRSSGPLGPKESLDVSVGGTAAAVLNVTVTQPTAAGFLKVYAAGSTSQPPTSNLNFVAGQTVPNLVLTKVGSLGTVTIFNGSSGTVHVFADVAGYGERLYPVVVPAPAGASGTASIGSGVCTGPGQCMFVGDYGRSAGSSM